jgi:dolichyldiphosphatase
MFGRAKRQFMNHPIITWLEIRDGWVIWPDGGRADEWQRWRVEWEKHEIDKKKLN